MSEVAESESPSTVTQPEETSVEKIDADPTPAKRRRLSENANADKLEHRLGGILCCAVCLDLPRTAVYQCSNGHLMCAACFFHLLADARLRDESATCPNCRIEISKTSASRNLAVEKAISELPNDCKFCSKVFPRHTIEHHEKSVCDDRSRKIKQIIVHPPKQNMSTLNGLVRIVACLYNLVLSLVSRKFYVSRADSDRKEKRRKYCRISGCRYAVIGCQWRGPHHELGAHEAECAHPGKSAADLLEVLAARDAQQQEVHAVYSHVLELLSYEKIVFNDVQLKPYRTDEFVNKLYYETSRFSAFNQQWVIKAHVNNNQRDPTQSSEREITYQLILKTKSPVGLSVQYLALRGPHGEARLRARVCSHTFAPDEPADAPPQPLPLIDPSDANRLLSNKAIHFRICSAIHVI